MLNEKRHVLEIGMILNRVIRISEIFTSIQGEGLRVGVPSLFIRFYGCSKHCVWCDTPYAKRWFFNGKRMSIGEIVEVVKQKEKEGIRDVVITGGEPTLQSRELTYLIEEIHNQTSMIITLETNAFHMIEHLKGFLNNIDILSISPKLSNSFRKKSKYSIEAMIGDLPDFIDTWLIHYTYGGKIQLKFVIKNKKDIGEVKKVVEYLDEHTNLYKKSRNMKFSEDDEIVRIFLMPLGKTKKEIERRSRWLWEECIKHGFFLSDRSHVRLFGNKRGK